MSIVNVKHFILFNRNLCPLGYLKIVRFIIYFCYKKKEVSSTGSVHPHPFLDNELLSDDVD